MEDNPMWRGPYAVPETKTTTQAGTVADPRIVAGCLLLRRVNTDTGEEAMVGIRASEITMWQECDDGTTLLYGHRQYPICAVRETWEQIAQLKQLAEKR